MKLRSGSFSEKLLRRSRSKAKLEDITIPVPDMPVPPILPTVKLDAVLHLPFFTPSSSSSSSSAPTRALPVPNKGLHRRSRSFSELLSVASSTGSHAQPWRSREAWAAIHSPSQEPVKKKPEARVMDRTYGWIERGDHQSSDYASGAGERDVIGRQDFKFFHNSSQKVPPSAIDSDDEDEDVSHRVRISHRDMRQPPRSRLNESVTMTISRDSTSSSSISTMDLSLNPHTPPTSIDNDFPNIHSHSRRHGGPHSATPSNDSYLSLPPLIPDLVKRADSPPAFTGFPSPAPWAQRSPRKDIREASNLRWAHDDKSTDSIPESLPRKPLNDRLVAAVVASRRGSGSGSGAQTHQRKRSTTLPSGFSQTQPASLSSTEISTVPQVPNPTEIEARPESGTLPTIASVVTNPPRPARHPRRLPPVPVLVHAPSSHQYTNPTTTIPESPETSPSAFTPDLIPPSMKGPSAYYRPSNPLRSAASHHSLKPTARRPSTAPAPPSSSPLAFGSQSQSQSQSQGQGQGGQQRQTGLHHNSIPSPLPSATFQNQRRSRQHSGTASAERGGWI